MNVKPSMRQTNEGKALLTKARVRLNKAHYEKHGGILVDDQHELDMEEEKKEAPTADLTQVFPELNSATAAKVKPTVRRIKADEREICKKLIKKYGPESHGKMARDIKLNYLQWSKGQIAKNIELYRISIGEIKAEFKSEQNKNTEE